MAGPVKKIAGRKISAFAVGLVLVGAGFATSGPAAAAAMKPTTNATGSAPAPAGHKGGKLSPRLLALSRDPRAGALSLPRSGAGSLVRHPDGRVVAQIRMSDLSAA